MGLGESHDSRGGDVVVTTALKNCLMCGLSAPSPLHGDKGEIFCCPACREVHALIQIERPASPVQQNVEIPSIETTFTLSGMWCTSCGWLIAETLERTPGVQTAQVSFARHQAQVVFDPTQVDVKRLLRRIGGLGYRAWPADEPAPHDEEESLANRLLFGGMFAIQIMMMSMGIYAREWFFASPDNEYLVTYFNWVNLIGTLPLIPLFAFPILRAGVASLLSRTPNMHTLISIGTIAAFLLSIRNLLAGIGHVYFDTVAMLLFLVSLGRWLEVRAQKSSGDAVERLWKKIPHTATWLSPEGEKSVPVDELPIGARVWVRPGETFPVDGIIAVGEGDVDESILTGEPLPVTHRNGEQVMAGSINVDGSFEVITTAIGAQTVAGKIGKMLHQSLWERTPVQQLADKMSVWMVTIATLLAVGTFAFWTWQVNFETGLLNALSVLLIACPCALGLATPLTVWSAVGRAAEAGMIIRSGSALERLAEVRSLYFDKTGTLTQSEFVVQDIFSANGSRPADILMRVAAAERPSEHPLGKALVVEAEKQAIHLPDTLEFRALPGQGVTARVGDHIVWVGSRRLMDEQKLELPSQLNKQILHLQHNGQSVVYAGWGGAVQGIIGLSEQARPNIKEAVAALQSLSLNIAVLTGDDLEAGKRWEAQLNIPVLADLRPEDKINHIKATEGSVAMVGDGINDGPALASADVGLSLRQGTDVARAAADIILLKDDLMHIPWLVGLGRMTLKRVRQNLAWAFVYNVIGLALAVSGLLLPVLSALAMVISSTLVTGNALRLMSYPLIHESTVEP